MVGPLPGGLAVVCNCIVKLSGMEARAGIEPTYTDLQSAASPLCHRAILTGTGAPFPVRPRCGAVV